MRTNNKILVPTFEIEFNSEKGKTICRNASCENPILEARLCRECLSERKKLVDQMLEEIKKSI
jgi:hypothetical protein